MRYLEALPQLSHFRFCAGPSLSYHAALRLTVQSNDGEFNKSGMEPTSMSYSQHPADSNKWLVIFLVLLVGIDACILVWHFILCPGRLGRFFWLECRCKEGAAKPSSYGRCTCIPDKVERKGECVLCGGNASDIKQLQPPCQDGLCKVPFVLQKDGMCHKT